MSTTENPKAGTKPPLSPQDALDMLASAVNYLRQAGVVVRAGNNAGKLVLAIDGAEMVNAGKVTRFVASTPDAGKPVLANSETSAGK